MRAPLASTGSQIDDHESLDKYVEDDFMSILLRCGLFLGAIFQLVCIGASILLKSWNGGNNDDGDSGEEQKSLSSGRLQKFRKQEKKKRR